MDNLKDATQCYYDNGTYSDFTVICGDRKWRIHRCIVAAQSKWFERCFSGSFVESTAREVKLEDDLLEAVACMMEFFYKFTYDVARQFVALGDANAADTLEGPRPVLPAQLHAYVYALAEKYDVPRLKTLALEGYEGELAELLRRRKSEKTVAWQGELFAVAHTTYNWIELPDRDRALQNAIVSAFMQCATFLTCQEVDRTLVHQWIAACSLEMPEFTADLVVALLQQAKNEAPTLEVLFSNIPAAVLGKEAKNLGTWLTEFVRGRKRRRAPLSSSSDSDSGDDERDGFEVVQISEGSSTHSGIVRFRDQNHATGIVRKLDGFKLQGNAIKVEYYA